MMDGPGLVGGRWKVEVVIQKITQSVEEEPINQSSANSFVYLFDLALRACQKLVLGLD